MSIVTPINSPYPEEVAPRAAGALLLNHRKVLILGLEALLVAFSLYASVLLRYDFRLSAEAQTRFLYTLPLVLAVKLLLFSHFGLLHGWWRYTGIGDVLDISRAAAAASCVLFLAEFVLQAHLFSLSVIVTDLALTILLLGGARLAVRAYTENVQADAAGKNTLVVGAGQAGCTIVRELKRNPGLDYRLMGLVDDDPTKRGMKLHGVRVLGTTAMLPWLIAKYEIARVLIAIPSASGSEIERIVNRCQECKVDFKILPPVAERICGKAKRQIRKVRVEDLIGRHQVQLDLERIKQKLQDRVILITGAGGSIGSELARQLASFHPKKLVFLERSENDLFRLCTEFGAKFPSIKFVPVVGDILDVGLLRKTFAMHHPNSVFHAAAYKHVPLMETNCFQAVTNNVFGTYNVALIARQYGVEDFVMISSDKAVNPTNVMGVTKRVAELIMLSLARQRTRFIAVRFGNVLGSNGSVLPLFQQQIAGGGPVTLTHPEMRRYFMTIPEAAQLVLQAATMGSGGEIFVLDMGQPVRIVDLARNLIRLSGLQPDRDVQIVFTGLRPGEKLFEELMLEGEGLKPTSHQKVRVLEGGSYTFEQVQSWLDDLSSLVDAGNVYGLVAALKRIVPAYTPSEEMLSLSEVDRHDLSLRYSRERATLPLPPTAVPADARIA
jgi:FlaA1/EpsC-like NDP-sugar epimerase